MRLRAEGICLEQLQTGIWSFVFSAGIQCQEQPVLLVGMFFVFFPLIPVGSTVYTLKKCGCCDCHCQKFNSKVFWLLGTRVGRRREPVEPVNRRGWSSVPTLTGGALLSRWRGPMARLCRSVRRAVAPHRDVPPPRPVSGDRRGGGNRGCTGTGLSRGGAARPPAMHRTGRPPPRTIRPQRSAPQRLRNPALE